MAKRYEEVDHPSDICIRVYGDTIEEIFSNAGFAIFDIQYDLAHVSDEVSKDVKVSAPDVETALVRFLNELLYISDADSIVFKEFEVRCKESENGVSLVCRGRGSIFDPSRHRKGILIKAVSYNQLKIDMEKKEATIVLDT